MEKLRTLSGLLITTHGCTNTSPRTKKTIIQPVRKYCATVGHNVVTWNEVNCYPATHRRAHSPAISRTKYQFPFFFVVVGGGGGVGDACISHSFMSQRIGR
jgi:hypothetical protein